MTHEPEAEAEPELLAEERTPRFRGEARRIHAVADRSDDVVRMRCGYREASHRVDLYDEQPPHMTGNNICYNCVRAGDAVDTEGQ